MFAPKNKKELSPAMEMFRKEANDLQVRAMRTQDLFDIIEANRKIHSFNESLVDRDDKGYWTLCFVDKDGALTTDSKKAPFDF